MAKRKNLKNKNLIKFHKGIYKTRAIKSAIQEFKHLADFNLKEKGKYIEVSLKNIDKSAEKVIQDEFSNYVLFLIKS